MLRKNKGRKKPDEESLRLAAERRKAELQRSVIITSDKGDTVL